MQITWVYWRVIIKITSIFFAVIDASRRLIWLYPTSDTIFSIQKKQSNQKSLTIQNIYESYIKRKRLFTVEENIYKKIITTSFLLLKQSLKIRHDIFTKKTTYTLYCRITEFCSIQPSGVRLEQTISFPLHTLGESTL